MGNNNQIPKRRALPLAILATVLLSGCASFSADGGLGTVSDLTRARTGQDVARTDSADAKRKARSNIDKLLEGPLTVDAAVQVALLNNQALQAAFDELGVAEADFVQSGRLRNPGFTFSHLRNAGGVEIDRSVGFDLAGLITLPLRKGIGARRFEQAKLQAASSAVGLAANVRKAYFDTLAAKQTVAYATQVQTAAEASVTLMNRMARVGNVSRLDQAREQAFYADSTAQLARAQQTSVSTRERLIRLLGLWGNDIAFVLPERLPDLPKAPQDIANLEQRAIAERLDVLMARRDLDATASALGLTRATRFLNVLDAGYANKSLSGQPRENGYSVALELPIFDWGGARTAKAEAQYMQSVHRTADTAIRARSEVREAYAGYRTAYDLARHYRDEVVPIRKQISDEIQLRYNGMLVSVFELLVDAREQANSVNAAINAQRDFWIADTTLQSAISGAASGGESATATGMMNNDAR